jgi:hypothetical protein
MSRKSRVSFALAAVVLGLAFLLNPSPDRHRRKIEGSIAERSPIAGALGVASLTAFASTYHSLGIASYTTAGKRTVSLGAFGMIYVLR